MAKHTIIIEQASDGTLWGRIEYGDDLLTTSGENIAELKRHFGEQLEGFYREDISKTKFEVKYDISAFFEHYSELNISAIGKKAGINTALLRQYKNRIKYPSQQQIKKIEDALHAIGRELSSISLVALPA